MKYLLGLLALLGVIAFSASLVFAFDTVTAPPEIKPKDTPTVDTVSVALASMGMGQPNGQTMVISASQDVDLPVTTLWNTWAHLEDWPAWSPMVSSARWLGDTQWKVGSTFVEVLNLGAPLGRQTVVETISELTPGRSAEWCRDQNGIRSCHVWMFEALVDGKTRVTNTEVFQGAPVYGLRPAVSQAWQRGFEQAVAGLVARSKTHTVK